MTRHQEVKSAGDDAVALLKKWIARAHASLDNDRLTPQERARIGELAINAASWLASRERLLELQARRAERGEP